MLLSDALFETVSHASIAFARLAGETFACFCTRKANAESLYAFPLFVRERFLLRKAERGDIPSSPSIQSFVVLGPKIATSPFNRAEITRILGLPAIASFAIDESLIVELDRRERQLLGIFVLKVQN